MLHCEGDRNSYILSREFSTLDNEVCNIFGFAAQGCSQTSFGITSTLKHLDPRALNNLILLEGSIDCETCKVGMEARIKCLFLPITLVE